MGPYDYYVYSNSLVDKVKDLNDLPIKTVGQRWVSVGDVGEAKDANQIQYNIVRVDGQKSAYIPIMKQGGDTNTIQVVNGIRDMIPQAVRSSQAAGGQRGVRSVGLRQGGHQDRCCMKEPIGLVLTSLMILIFLGSMRATLAVLLSIPISALATFVVLYLVGSTVNTMILGGLALAFSRVIDNSVISLENIYRHLEMGASPEVAAETGGSEVSLAVLAATLIAVVVFFPGHAPGRRQQVPVLARWRWPSAFAVRFLRRGDDRDSAVLLPLPEAACSTAHEARQCRRTAEEDFNAWFNRGFQRLLDVYEAAVRRALRVPALTVVAVARLVRRQPGDLSVAWAVAFFPRTDAGQFTINLKVPTGTRIEVTEQYVAQGRGSDPQGGRSGGFQDDRLQHRGRDRFLGSLHHQRRPVHGHDSGRS